MFESFRASQRYQKLIRMWVAYRDMVQRFEGAKGVTDDHEKRFLKLKACCRSWRAGRPGPWSVRRRDGSCS